MNNKPSEETIRRYVTEAVEIEKEFVCDSLPCALVGMNAGMMSDYIEYVADHLFASLGLAKEYNTANPFDWMELISLQGKTNFFEKRVGEYQKAGVMNSIGGGNATRRSPSTKTSKRNGHMRKLFHDFSESEARVYELSATSRRRDGIYSTSHVSTGRGEYLIATRMGRVRGRSFTIYEKRRDVF